jgi:DNA-binding NtrC family response regulator
VLIQGESGVGKEVISKIIHSLSAQKHNTFIAINTGALPEGTINSELFGHEKGAFTGATSDRKGYFETASGGTIFLDEIGEMPLDTQAYLLRVLESGEYIKVGSSKVNKTEVRVIAATNVDLLDRVRNGKFREDLYYRLNTVPIKVPSLKERREDIYMLFRKFSQDFAEKYRTESIQLDPEAKTLIVDYNWPGNVRELRNVVEQLSILSEDRLITKERLNDLIPNITQRYLPSKVGQNGADDMHEREILYKVLFDMKNDLQDLKGLIFELIKTNDLRVSDVEGLKQMELGAVQPTYQSAQKERRAYEPPVATLHEPVPFEHSGPVLVSDEEYDQMEVVENNLSLEEMEKDYIIKALKKYNGRRKEAAKELGISERTLYRKIKYYGI